MVGLALSIALVGCTGDGGSDGVAGDTGGPAPVAGETLSLLDDQNYAYSGTLAIPSVQVAESTDLLIDWTAMSEDMRCHEVDPVADIDNVALLLFRYQTEADVSDGLAKGSLQQVDLSLYVNAEPGNATSVALTDLTFFGTDPEILTYTLEENGTWLLVLTTGTEVALGTRALSFFAPRPGETNTTVEVGGQCDVLDFDANLSASRPLRAALEGPWPLDWGGLSLDGMGQPFDAGKVDGLMIGRYSGLELDELETRFLDLELIADDLWRLELEGGHTSELGLAVDADGAAFPGFDAGGIYLLGLLCSSCPNPAPLFLTVVSPG